MITISGYDITEQIYDGVRAVVYRGRREQDNLPVVVKIHQTDFPSSKEIARFRREVEIGTMLIPRALSNTTAWRGIRTPTP